jgi:DNA-binding transcriptional LysR family regulator
MQDLNAMYLFAKVVDHGGYTAAARALGLQTSKLSRRISELEAELGVRLLNRTTRKMSLTEVGSTYYAHCAALVAEAESARESVDRTRASPSGLVRISCPVALLNSNVGAIVAEYLHDNPDVRMHIEATNRRVDVVEEGFDVSIRVRSPPLEDSGLVIRQLDMADTALVASPSLFVHRPRPTQPSELSGLPTLTMERATERHTWRFNAPDGSMVAVAHVPRLITEDFQTLIQAAIEGVGVTYVPTYMAKAHIESGRLERLLPEFNLPNGIVHAVFPSRRGLVPAVRSFIDALVAGFDASRPYGGQPVP